MNDAVTLAIQIPVGASGDLRSTLERLAGELRVDQWELAGTWEHFLSVGDADDSATTDVPAWASPICSRFIEGLVNDHPPFGKGASETSHEEQLNRLFARALDAGVGQISIAPARIGGTGTLPGSYACELNWTAALLSMVLPITQCFGVDVRLRAGEGRFLTSPVEMREFITAMNAPSLGVELSTQMAAGLPPWRDWFSTLEPYVRTVRIDIEPPEDISRVISGVREVQEAIKGLCHPRSYAGVVTVRLLSESLSVQR